MTKEVLANNSILMLEWDKEKNNSLGLDAQKLSLGSSKKAWWRCKNGHEWITQISVRAKGHGCPFCAHAHVGKCNSKVQDKSRILTTYYPEIVNTWNYKRNKELMPDMLSYMSNKKVWWVCSECGKEWQANIYSRVRHKTTTCKSCSMKKSKRVFLKVGINDLATLSPMVAKEWNYEKNGKITPKDVCAKTAEQYWWKCKNGHEWRAKVCTRTKDGYRGCPYCAHRRVIRGENDFRSKYPELAKYWHHKKNGLKASDIAAYSNIKYWWVCDKGHEWLDSPNNMSRRAKCPYCSNNKVLSGFNDLATLYPDIAEEWDYEKNKVLKPTDVLYGSSKKIWWKCNVCGYKWGSSVVARTKQGHGCPVCKNRVVVCGVNDLATVNPNLAAEWNYERNGDLTPEKIIAGSPKSVWWKCKNGHEWKATIVSRNKGHFCPYCDASKHTSISEKSIVYYLKKCGIDIEENKRVNNKELDVFIPSINTAIEYDGQYYHKNKDKDLQKNKLCKELGIQLIRVREPGLPLLNDSSVDIVIDSFKNDYTHLNSALKTLFSYLKINYDDIDISRDFNEIYNIFELSEKADSIKTSFPLLAKEWDYEKNTIQIEKVSKGAHIRAWWICSKCGYKYEAMVYSRCNGSGCPKCANRLNCKKPEKLITGVNDFKTIYPELAAEWDYEKNSFSPETITYGSNKKAWWICKKGHSYESSVSNRVKGCGCPYCIGKKVLRGFNDLYTTNPEIAAEWNHEKNAPITPYDVSIGSGKKYWWKCSECGKEWMAAVYTRKKANCSDCNRKKRFTK